MQTLADRLQRLCAIRWFVDHYKLRAAAVFVSMQRKRWLCHRVEEFLQVLDGPWAIARLFARYRALPPDCLWRINEDSNINMLARKRMQGV